MSVSTRVLLLIVMPVALAAQQPDSAALVARVDRVIASVADASAPGCAVGIARDGRTLVERAFGMADIEQNIPNTPQTIFESGSVAKQFTAASVVLLALEGKVGLDEPVRKYIPELPDYGAPLTVRHLLNHTSGIRDWGSVLELTGYGRGMRMVSQALAFDVITHQRGIDFTPGAEYSYSNSGFTLLATIVERVSGQSLPEFTAAHFFKPLGMTHSTWRTDYTHLVAGRAQAYAFATGGGWKLDMPFMNVYGNGGLLSTVGDWLRWNEMLASRSMGGALVDSLEHRGRLNDGRDIAYALGLEVTTYKGQRQVAHSGGTAGYNAYLTRFPGLKLSIAVMCNGSRTNPTMLALRLVDELGGPLPSPPAPDTVSMSTADLQKRVALWRQKATHMSAQTVIENGTLRLAGGPVLHPLHDGWFLAGNGPARWQFEMGADGRPARARRVAGDANEQFVAETSWTPSAREVAAFVGDWRSDESGAAFAFAVENGQPVLRQRPDVRIALRPVYRDHFVLQQGAGEVVWFTRGASGTTMHLGISRTRDMPFVRAAIH